MTSHGAYGVLGAFIFMVLCNILASKKFFGGKDNKQLSDENPTYLTPDGKTFAVWGMIYLLEMVFVISQVFSDESTAMVLDRRCPLTGLDVRTRVVLAFMTNGVWLPVFNNERFWSAFVIIAIYLGLLVSIYTDLNTTTIHGLSEYICFAAGLTMNCSWVVVAICVSGFVCLGRLGWKDQQNVAGSVAGAGLVILLVTLVACFRAVTSCDLPWAFVAAWALMGIYRMQTVPDKVRFPLSAMSSNLGNFSRGCSYLVILAMALAACLAISKQPGYWSS